MQKIELDQEFFDSVKNDKREDVVNGIVNNVMSGQYEYACVGLNWNLQDFVNDALGEEKVCERLAQAVAIMNATASADSTILIAETVIEKLKPIVEAFCNREEVGIA